MAENKKSFILYTDLLEMIIELDDKTAGELFKHILKYVNDLDPITKNPLVKLAFIPVKQSLKRDLKKYDNKKEVLSKSGIIGNLKRWNRDLYDKYKAGKITLEKAQIIAHLSHTDRKTSPPDTLRSPPIASIAVTVNDTVTVSDSVSDTVTVKKKKEIILLCSISNENELSQNGFIAFSFWKLFKENLKQSGIKKTVTLDKAELSDWENETRLMLEKDQRSNDELKVVYIFLKKDDFWKKNILSIKKLRKQFEKLYQTAQIENKQSNGEGVDAEYLEELKARMK